MIQTLNSCVGLCAERGQFMFLLLSRLVLELFWSRREAKLCRESPNACRTWGLNSRLRAPFAGHVDKFRITKLHQKLWRTALTAFLRHREPYCWSKHWLSGLWIQQTTWGTHWGISVDSSFCVETQGVSQQRRFGNINDFQFTFVLLSAHNLNWRTNTNTHKTHTHGQRLFLLAFLHSEHFHSCSTNVS